MASKQDNSEARLDESPPQNPKTHSHACAPAMPDTTQDSDSYWERGVPIEKQCQDLLEKVKAMIKKADKNIKKNKEEIKFVEFWGPQLREYYGQFLPKPKKRKRDT
ncbi:hypothetical protein FKW77_005479 [Venturia effusa]|uniref:Uncharacterized protein n=1 Tax=Venturia effusa TaxID=50376 RepID=A0A517LH76_9PEZI|nr:hypothetical protein FKW77_005479 [Venturia effusa]